MCMNMQACCCAGALALHAELAGCQALWTSRVSFLVVAMNCFASCGTCCYSWGLQGSRLTSLSCRTGRGPGSSIGN